MEKKDRIKDCCFMEDNHWFRYRAGAIIVEDGKVLFVTSKSFDYYYTVGGGVHMGEKAEECVLREVYEETGIPYEIFRLAAVCENFFKGKGGKLEGLDCHCLKFYFLMKSRGNMKLKSDSYNWDDEKEEMAWLPIDKLQEYNIKPAFLKDRIQEIVEGRGVLHIVNDERNQGL